LLEYALNNFTTIKRVVQFLTEIVSILYSSSINQSINQSKHISIVWAVVYHMAYTYVIHRRYPSICGKNLDF